MSKEGVINFEVRDKRALILLEKRKIFTSQQNIKTKDIKKVLI